MLTKLIFPFIFLFLPGIEPQVLGVRHDSGNTALSVLNSPVSATDQQSGDWIDKLPPIKELPDPFVMNNGKRVKNLTQWRKHREELKEKFQFYLYGHFDPPAPVKMISISPDTIISSGDFTMIRRRVNLSTGPDGKILFSVNMFIPGKGNGPFPTIVTGDLCWGTLLKKLGEEDLSSLIKRGYIIAEFDRTLFVPDKNTRTQSSPGTEEFYDSGALVKWAWAYHRAVDYLSTLNIVDKSRITVTGLSRGGKTALLAGAFDERVALVAPNCSGTCGSGPLRFVDKGGEPVDGGSINSFSYWYCSNIQKFHGNNRDKLPFDQHCLIALVAPRAYLCTNGLKDLWANPLGTAQAHLAACEVFAALGARDKMGIFYNDTGHDHKMDKWIALLDFADKIFYGKTPSYDYNSIPFPNLKKAYSWSAPKEL